MSSSPRKLTMRAVAVIAALTSAIILAACGDDDSGSSGSETAGVCVDVATDVCVEVETPIKMAYFAFGLGSTWGAANAEEVESYAEEQGVDVTVFDPQFDPDTQFQQIQQAMTSGEYNALGVVAIDNDLVCTALTEDAPEAGAVVAAINQPLCGRTAEPDPDDYAPPGTLTFIGSSNVQVGLQEWFDKAVELNTGPQKVAVITGVETDGITKTVNTMLKDAPEDWEVVANTPTDYTSAQGFDAAQDILNAHPDTTLILSTFADTTTGIVRAASQAGMEDVAIVDYNGSGATAEMVCQGRVQFTVPEVPRTAAKEGIDAIVGAFEGEEVPRFIRLPQPPLERDEACDYQAEY